MFPSVILTFNFFGGGDGDDNDDDENGTDNDNDDYTTFAFEHVPPMIKLQNQSKQIRMNWNNYLKQYEEQRISVI